VREAVVHIDEQAKEIAKLHAIFAEPIPCDVMLPPATIFRKGVSLQTIRTAIDQRRTAPGVALSFDSPREVALSPGWLLRDIRAAAERFEAPPGDDAATSIAQMVTEWVDGGIAMGTDWRPGLASIIGKRLARFSQNEEIPWLLKELDEKDDEIAALRAALKKGGAEPHPA
jgi:hypothetical protein